MNNVANNVNFTAKMSVDTLATDKKHWKNIAQHFKQQTAKYTEDVIFINNFNDGVAICKGSSKRTCEFSTKILDTKYDELMKMADEEIVSKFKKLMDISAHVQKIYKATEAYDKKMSKLIKDEFTEDINIWTYARDIANKQAKDIKNKDSFLKGLEIDFS